MADFSKFRTALNGFNRADVVEYIESANREQLETIRALEDEANKLRDEKAALENDAQALRDENAALRDELQKLQEEDAALVEQLELFSQQAAEYAALAEAAAAQTEEPSDDGISAEAAAEFEDVFDELEDTPAPSVEEEAAAAAPAVSLGEQELAAYRRAEAAERNAVIRANKIHTQLGVLCDDARRRYMDSSDEISALTADLSAGLNRLNEAFAEIQLIFDDAENAFDDLDLPEIED